MKKLLFVLLFSCAAASLPAQSFLRFGLGAAVYDLKNFDALLDRYSAARPWLDYRPSHVQYMATPQLGIGHQFEYLRLEASWIKDTRTVHAGGIPPGATEADDREIKIKNARFSTALSVHPYGQSIGGGIAVDAGYFRTYSRLMSEDKKTRYDRNLSSGATFFLSFFPIYRRSSFGVQVYYRYALQTVSCEKLGAFLDPQHYASLAPADFKDNPSSYGITLSLAFSGE